MNETVTVREALEKGHRMVNYPMVIFMLVMIGLSVYLLAQKMVPVWVALSIGSVVNIGIAWLYWAVMVVKWRIWAFENVRNVHELKKNAIKELIIWDDDNIFGKTEFYSAADREKWTQLQTKFDKPDIFLNDFDVPETTEIYRSSGLTLFHLCLGVGMLGFGAYFSVTTDKNTIWGVVMALAGAWFCYDSYRKFIDKSPQIIISSKGIQTKTTPFQPWSVISNEDVDTQGYGKDSTTYLVYDYLGEYEEFDISELNISERELRHLLTIYRGRSRAKK